MIKLNQAVLYQADQCLMDQANVQLSGNANVGLIGRNGCGKTTLLNVLAGQHQLHQGQFDMPASWRIATVEQHVHGQGQNALDYVQAGDQQAHQLLQQIQQAEQDNQHEQLAHLHEQLNNADGYSLHARAARLLAGLGFDEAAQQRAVTEFSGGWQMRLALARALLCPSDVLLLDEPTNHLDLDAVLWLQQWLKRYHGLLIVVSHDRDFLDAVVSHILHVHNQKLDLYTGGYADFERQRAARLQQQQAQYQQQQRQMAHMQSFVDRFRAQATKAKQAQSRLKALQRMVLVAPVQMETGLHFEFPPAPDAGNPLLQVEQAQLGYSAQQPILDKVTMQVQVGGRIGLLGRNGAGKSTLIKSCAGDLALLAGERHANGKLRCGYFAQHQLDALNAEASPMQTMLDVAGPLVTEQRLRDYLGGYGFSGERISDPIRHFSGGQKARLVLAMLIWQKPNLLLLDEPTNHLDGDARDALVMALQQYTGAVIVVSHDRYLLRAICDEYYWVNHGTVQRFEGDLDDYEVAVVKEERNTSLVAGDADKRQSRQQQRREAAAAREELAQQSKPLKKAIRAAEKELAKLRPKLETLEAQLADPEIYNDPNVALDELFKQQGQLRQQIEALEDAWLEDSEALEALQAS